MTDKDDDKDDDTDDKAKKIGEKVGVDPPKEDDEDLPDYEIIEDKGDDTTVVDEKKADDGDERLGKRRDDIDKKHLSNREKRHLRKERLRKKIDAKDQLIRQQQDQINNLGGQIAQVNGRLANYDVAQVQTALNEANNYFNTAQAAYDAAFQAGDSVRCREAMTTMYESRRRIDDMQAIMQRLGKQPATQQVQQPNPGEAVLRKCANEWAARNPWFKPGGADEDSAIADAIAAKMRREGFEFTTEDDWDELDDRLAAKGIGEAQDDDEQDEKPVRRQEQTQRRKSPPVGGGGSGRGDLQGGKVQVTLPTAYIENLKQAGMWDDPKTRSKMVKKYIEGIRNRERGE